MSTLVVVTGGSAGLGRALLAAAPAGARRIDVSRSGPRPGDVALRDVHHLAVDLADPRAWAEVGRALDAELVATTHDRVTVIHNAGTLDPIGFAGEVDADAYTRNVLLNSAAPQVIGYHVLRSLAGRGGRRELVLLSSGAARTAYPGWSAYGAGKAATDHWVRAAGAEQERRGGVRVLAVAPGVVATDMQATIRATDEHDFPPVERFRRLHAEGALEDADDVARRLWALLDDDTVTTGSVVDLRDHRGGGR
jgi:benzil reductase ((S)-benzoin forming)